MQDAHAESIRTPTSLELRELRSLPAAAVSQLPMSSGFWLHHPDFAHEIRFTTVELVEPREPTEGIVFDALELEALVRGVCCDRLWREDFVELCAAKWADPALRIQDETTMAGALGDPGAFAGALSFGALLDRLGLTLIGIGPAVAPELPLALAA